MVARGLVTQLESVDDSTTAKYLSYWRGGQIPARMGYLIGYEIARKLAATTSVRELARLRGQRLLNVVRRETQILYSESSSRKIAPRPQKRPGSYPVSESTLENR